MIERQIVTQKIKEYQIKEYLIQNLKGVGLSHIKTQRTPLGEKIIIFASKPGLIIGSGGSNIKKMTKDLKRIFELENPQIEINEIDGRAPIAKVIAEKISGTLERYGPVRFKGIGYKEMSNAIDNGALGIEILISGKIPSARARTWRFYKGYLKKGGDAATSLVDTAYSIAKLKSGIVGVKVSVMPPGARLPDEIKLKGESPVQSPEKISEKKEEKVNEIIQKTENDQDLIKDEKK